MAFGIDFGTSNSVVALADGDGPPRFASFELLGRSTASFRSLLFFDLDEQRPAEPVVFSAGPAGIEAYLDALGEGRLIQSFKTHLTTASLGRTALGPHALDLDELLALFLGRLREGASAALGAPIERAVLGRPVRFAGSRDDQACARAEARLRRAALAAGLGEVELELEPIAAAYHYEAGLERDELAMIADFGAGTTDFCVMRIGPTHRGRRERSDDVLVTGGVGVAGDNLDAALIEHVVAPALGKGSYYREFGKRLPIPPGYYYKLSRWHQLSFLRGSRTRHELERLAQHAESPAALEALMMIIEDNQGFHLHEAVEATKIALSREPRAAFDYVHEDFEVHAQVERADFEAWIADEVAEIAACLDQTLARAGLEPAAIDRVFMTGGTAFVPAVRREFEARFGSGKLSSGDELSSIAAGLAGRARSWDAAAG
ncbi:Hsp70 family protein [Enhygromyxa salina]|uniref:Hsp70 family protein n=1 Tax=Enhygromyxa salina TaxID=215803 RepID=UPI0015E607EF|nr:Hsp70 family protein [Enhygromyxa salina]